MQLKHIKTVMLLSTITALFSCTKEISVDVTHEPQTIISGELTNLNQPMSISIQQSLPLNASESFNPVNDAVISLYEKDINGNTNLIVSSFSVNQGVYTSNQSITTTIGNTYWVEVTLTNGTLFKSQEEVMQPIVPISELTINDQFDDVLDIKFSDPETATNFYKVTVELYNMGTLVARNFSESNDVIFNGNVDASIGVDLFQENEEEEDNPLPEFDMIRATLGNINFSSYQFLLNQRAQIEVNNEAEESSGGNPSQLFSTPPVNLLGNITNTSTNRTVLGNFTVISLSSENQ